MFATPVVFIFTWMLGSSAISIPGTAPSAVSTVDAAQLSLSLEFFAFPGYTNLPSTANCIANIAALRGAQPAIRIGGTTQDRATYDPNLSAAVNYTVANLGDAPSSLTFGPSFFSLATSFTGDVTIGLNRQLNNQTNSLLAAVQAKQRIPNLLAIELGNEPEYYASNSPIVPNGNWDPTVDGASQKLWFTNFASESSVGDIFQAAVYLNYPTWSTAGLIPLLGSAITHVKTFSGHSYPQSASTANLASLMSHSGIVSYISRYKSESAAAHSAGKSYFFGETNSATGGGGGISPTFGAALWIIDYTLQAALNGIQRLYFHQGTIGNCQYCWWGQYTVGAPYYGAAFLSEFLGKDGSKLSMLDDGTGAVGSYVLYSAAGQPVRLLVYNSNYYNGTGTRSSASVSFTGGSISSGVINAKRLTAPASTSRVDEGAAVTIGGGGTFDSKCTLIGSQTTETVAVSGGAFTVALYASEALVVYL